MTPNKYFSLLMQTEKILLMTFDDTNAGIRDILWTHTWTKGRQRMERHADVELEMII